MLKGFIHFKSKLKNHCTKKSTQICPHKSFEGVTNSGLSKKIKEIPKISLRHTINPIWKSLFKEI
jgi:hypothetical protein